MSEINALSQDIPRQEAGNANVAEWYEATIDSIPKSALKLLGIFTGFEKEGVVDHLNAMVRHVSFRRRPEMVQVPALIEYSIKRSKAWFTASYPDMDSVFFLRFNMSQHPLYDYILARLIKDKNSRLTDVGCGLGQDVLKLVYGGASGSNIDTVDIDESVAKVGVDLFRCRLTNEEEDEEDKDTDTQHYIGDVFDLPPGHNSYNFVHAGALFHLFDRARQVELGIRLVSLLKDNQENLIFGHQLACVDSGPVFVGPNEEEAFLPQPGVLPATLGGDRREDRCALARCEPDGGDPREG